MKTWLSLFVWAWACITLCAQNNSYFEVVAEQGDGIFSILRKQGLDPVKHYEEFVKLNEGAIKDGSFLQIGVSYKIPIAKDSFKETGILVKTIQKTEEPIFDKELAQMSLKSEKLRDAVYYLILENHNKSDDGFVHEIVQEVTAALMVHGAKVYVMGDEVPMDSTGQNPLTDTQRMALYTDIINKRYIQNSGKYQRVLVIQANEVSDKENLDVAVYHYNKSDEGQRLAESIQTIFRKNSLDRYSSNVEMILEDKKNLYLARNILPAISVLTLEKYSKNSKEKIPVRPDKAKFASLISNGILNDYVDLEIEN